MSGAVIIRIWREVLSGYLLAWSAQDHSRPKASRHLTQCLVSKPVGINCRRYYHSGSYFRCCEGSEASYGVRSLGIDKPHSVPATLGSCSVY